MQSKSKGTILVTILGNISLKLLKYTPLEIQFIALQLTMPQIIRLALYLEQFLPQFRMSQNSLNCAGHIFNLVAKAGLLDVDKPAKDY